jgi:hypothetical protein
MANSLRTHYRQLPMPRYVWLVELACADQNLSFGPTASASCVFGELLFDTTMPDADHMTPLAAHVLGVVAGQAVEGHNSQNWAYLIPDDHMYAPFHPPAMIRSE